MDQVTPTSPCNGLREHEKQAIDQPAKNEWPQAVLQLAAWCGWWSQWNADLMERATANLKKLDEDDYWAYLDQLAQWGEEMRHEGCKNVKELKQIIKRAQARGADKGGGIIIDSTQPPPPPFKRQTR